MSVDLPSSTLPQVMNRNSDLCWAVKVGVDVVGDEARKWAIEK